MVDYVVWFVIGFGLVIAELLTGTFYLGHCGCIWRGRRGGTARSFCRCPAGDGGGGQLGRYQWLRQSRRRLRDRATSDHVQNMDVGQTVRVDQWAPNRTARANYRGATWDVELVPGEEAASGEFVIRSINANRLIVAAKPRWN